MTVTVSFGECRELALFKSGTTDNAAGGGDNSCIHFQQPNNGVFTVGAGVGTRFRQGINALPAKEQEGKGGRIVITLRAWAADKVVVNKEEQEKGSSAAVVVTGADEPVPADGPKVKKLTKKQEKRKEQRKAWRLQKMQERRAANASKSPTDETPARTEEGDTDTIDGDTVDA
jgi:hypothetical protein